MSCLIKLNQVVRTYYMGDNQVDALKGVSLEINAGELVAIIGPSGSGKSSLMNILGLLDTPTSGEYILGGKAMAASHDDELAKLRNDLIGFVFQSFFLLPKISALQNVCLPLFYRHEGGEQAEAKARAMLKKVGMEPYIHHKPVELSGGQQQRVAVARALVGAPKLVLADEPTGALDSKIGQDVMDLFIELNEKEKVTMIIITHDEKIAAQCKRVVHVQDGLLV